MKKIIAKTLSILLVIAMLVPMMGIMTSAEEELVNIFQASYMTSSSLTPYQDYVYEEYNIKPGDVITIAPISKDRSAILHTIGKGGDVAKSYVLKDIYVEDVTNGTAIVQFTAPDNTESFQFNLNIMFSDCTLITVNQPFTAEEYLNYMDNQEADLSSLFPQKYVGEFKNVFSKSDTVFNVRFTTKYVNGKYVLTEKEASGYYTSDYIPVKEGDIVFIADTSAKASVYFFDQDKQYLSYASTSNMLAYINDSALSCVINAFKVTKGIAYMRVVARSTFTTGNLFVTINQPITSFNEYKFLTTPVLTIEGSYTYTGERIEPPVEVKLGGKVLKKDEDYTLSYNQCINAGAATVTAEFIGDYLGLPNIRQSFVIAPKSVEDASVSVKLAYEECTYNDRAKRPAVTVAIDGQEYIDFSKKYSNNIDAGTATVTVTLRGNYSGTISKTFTILPEKITLDSSNLVLSTTEYTYTGSPIIPEFSFNPGIKGLKEGKDYIITYENNVNAGTATVTATLIGNYSGSISKTFTIAPREVVLVWENTDMMYNGERQTPTAKLFGVVAGDVCDVTVSGWGKFGGTYTAKVESISNENYVLSGDTTCQFTIIANPIEVAIDVACDIYDIIPDSAKQAVADAAVEAAKNAASDLANAAYEVASDLADTAIEAAETKAAEIKDTVESAYDQARDFFTGLFGSFSFFG